MGAMSFFLGTVALAFGIALVTGGSLSHILDTRLRLTWALFAALGLQFTLDMLQPSRPGGAGLGYGVLVASYVLLLAFCAANLNLRGMSVVLIGIALNAMVITVDRGMPIRTGGGEIRPTVKHHAEEPSDRLMPLADIIVVPPLNQALSFGDLIMVVGLVDVLVHRSRAAATGPRRRPRPDPTSAVVPA
jgi:Family of unknown function (DUF5317)